MKKLIFLFLFSLIFLTVKGQEQTYTLISDDAVTSTNDTLSSGWVDIKWFEQADIFVVIGDSISFNGGFTVFARTETSDTNSLRVTPYTTAADTATISNLGGTLLYEVSGKVLRGFTANSVPGATKVKIIAVRRDYSTAVTSSLKVYLQLRSN